MIPIETDALFAIPFGQTIIPQEACDVFKTLEGSEQNSPKTDCFNVLDEHPRIKQDIVDIFSLWANSVHDTPQQKWMMTTSWVTLNPDGSPMAFHRHYNCMYSGVLYFDKVDEKHSGLEFMNPISYIHGSFFLAPLDKERTNVFNRPALFGPIKEGLMLFFPSYVVHGHQAFPQTDVVRKSFACNFFPIGEYGMHDSTINTQWIP